MGGVGGGGGAQYTQTPLVCKAGLSQSILEDIIAQSNEFIDIIEDVAQRLHRDE